MEKPILPKSWQDLGKIPENLARFTNVGLQSSISVLVVHTHQVSLSTHQVPLAKNEKWDSLSNEQHGLTILK